MRYYRVINDASYRHPVTRQWEDPYKGEVLTKSELKERAIPMKQVEIIDRAPEECYFFFGKRFCD